MNDATQTKAIPLEARVAHLEVIIMGSSAFGGAASSGDGLLGISRSILDQLMELNERTAEMDLRSRRAEQLYQQHRYLLLLLLGVNALLTLTAAMVLVASWVGHV